MCVLQDAKPHVFSTTTLRTNTRGILETADCGGCYWRENLWQADGGHRGCGMTAAAPRHGPRGEGVRCAAES